MKKTFIFLCGLMSLSSFLSSGMDKKKAAWGDTTASATRKQSWGTPQQNQEKKKPGAPTYKDAVAGTQKMMYRSSRSVIANHHAAQSNNPKSAPSHITLLRRTEEPECTHAAQQDDEQSDDTTLFIPQQIEYEEEKKAEVPELSTAILDQKTISRLTLMADMLPKVLAAHKEATSTLEKKLLLQEQAHADQMQTIALHFQQQLTSAHREFDAQMLATQKAHHAQLEMLEREHVGKLTTIEQMLATQNFQLYHVCVRLGIYTPSTLENKIEQAEQQLENSLE